MPNTAKVTSKSSGSTLVPKTFVTYFGANGKEMETHSLGLGYIDDATAEALAHDKAPKKARKYKIFDATATRLGQQKNIFGVRPRPHMRRRTLRYN